MIPPDVDLSFVRIPMRMRFRRVTWREAVLIHGPEGWGEFSPFPDYPPEVTARWLAAALEAACSPWPPPVREAVPVNVTIPSVDPETAADLVSASGARTAKVKVAEAGTTVDDDVARVDAVRAALGPGGAVRLDANAAWSVDDAVAALARFGPLEYVEQPVATIPEMIELRRRTGVRIAADEVVRLGPDPLAVVAAGAADVLVLKVQPLGGMVRTADVARRAGVPVVVSSALETSVGIAAGLAVAAALPDLPYACGLGTAALLAGDVVDPPLLPRGGLLAVARPEPAPELLDRWSADRETESRLMRRLRSAAELLT